jgi:hypothetical protein
MQRSLFKKDEHYTITQLAKALGVSFKVLAEKVDSGDLQPDYVAPFTNKKYFSRRSIESKYLTSTLQRA